MQRTYILFFCYLLMRNDCYGCQMRGNNPLCSLFLSTHKNEKRDFRKLTRNILQSNTSEIETLPKIVQDKARVNKQPYDIPDVRTSPLLMPQTNIFQENLHENYKIRNESGSPKYKISVSSMLQNSNYEIDTRKQVSEINAIHYDIDAYPKDVKLSDLSMPQNGNFKRDVKDQVTASNLIHHDNHYKIHYEFGSPNHTISASSMLENSNFKRNTGKQVTETNAIYYDKDVKFSDLSMPQNSNFKRAIEKQVTARNMIHYNTGKYTKNAKSTETIKLSEHQENGSVRIKREEMKDSQIYFDLDKDPKAEKGIKILEQKPGETKCNYNQCVEICNTIYFAIPLHLAQCLNNTCFCFPKKDIYPPVIKNFMKTHKLFGIQQTYE